MIQKSLLFILSITLSVGFSQQRKMGLEVINENEIHLSRLININIDKQSGILKEKISLNEEIRSSLYYELLKETKISTNNQMLNAVINSY